jgi:hypothetical protein
MLSGNANYISLYDINKDTWVNKETKGHVNG